MQSAASSEAGFEWEMASNGAFGVRRMGSPNQNKMGPMRATLPFGYSPKKSSPASSPVPLSSSGKSRKSPDQRSSPERTSPCSPAGFKGKSRMCLERCLQNGEF